MPTVAQIAKLAYDAVSSAIPGSIHAATVNGASAGRVLQDDKSAPSGFPSSTPRDKSLTVYCEGFTPSVGDTLGYNGTDHLVYWVHDILAANGLVRAAVMPESEWLSTAVTFERSTYTRTMTGGRTETWATLSGSATAACVVAMSGREEFASDRVEAIHGYRVMCEYFAGLKESDRVVIGGRAHNIQAINNHEQRGDWLILDVDLGVAVGYNTGTTSVTASFGDGFSEAFA